MADIDIELLAIFGVFALGIFYLLLRLWPRAATEPDRGPGSEQYPKVVFERPYNRADSTDQLRAVMAATFTPRKVMQSAEYQAFLAVEQEVHASWRGCRVFAQTALGEVIESQDRAAHSAINSKRADFLVIRPNGLPALAIEYQGDGHYRRDAAARDAVKKEALRKAGVEYLEVREFHSAEQIKSMVGEALTRALRVS
jgi:hypothetical protein